MSVLVFWDNAVLKQHEMQSFLFFILFVLSARLESSRENFVCYGVFFGEALF